MTPEQFLEWLDKEIEHSKWLMDNFPADTRGHDRASDGSAILTEVKKKFLTLTPPSTTLS